MALRTARLSRATGGQPPRPGIVHLGLGAFHRAHQAVYTDDALAAAGGDWGIIAVAPRRAEVATAINEQDGLFSVTDLGAAGASTRVVGSLVGARHLPSEGEQIVELLADPAIRVVTLTVTEKAYLTDATGRLLDDPQLRLDLTTDRPPRTVLGLLVRGLRRRAGAGGPPLAVVSCDNLPANGARLRGALGQALGAEPFDWVRFPSTMVDRIVPASTGPTYARAQAALGLVDLAAVEAEPFSQWVIEEHPGDPGHHFPAGRPAWEAGGAIFTAEVSAYEQLKLRLLNGAHSTLAYLGALAGAGTIVEALAWPGMAAFVGQLMVTDVAPTLRPPTGVSVEAYAASVLARFENPAIRHGTDQVAMDGSQKLPQRIFATVRDRRAAGAEPRYLATTIAAWIQYLGGVADDGRPLRPNDPLAEPLQAALRGAADDPVAQVRAVFGVVDPGRPSELAEDEALVALVAERLTALRRAGVKGLLATR